MKTTILLTTIIMGLGAHATWAADSLDAATQAKLDVQIKAIQGWAGDPAIVKAAKDCNAKPPADYAGMDQDKWKSLTIMDPLVRGLTKNDAATLLKGKKTDAVTEAFLSGADGTKVAFLSKTTSWSHKGKAKHDRPMAGKTWQGPVEVDESTGQQQVQVAVPVLDDGKSIGSLVVGLSVSKLKD